VSREWKPGDVLTNADGAVFFVTATLPVSRAKAEAGAWKEVLYRSGTGLTSVDTDGNGWRVEGIKDARPLAVIDPEDREQVERLSRYIAAAECGDGMAPLDAVQAALREFADPTPPKPAEPTGLGAVVECSDGRVFVVDHVHSDGTPRWYGPDVPGGDAYSRPAWSTIPAVKVLSEGVS